MQSIDFGGPEIAVIQLGWALLIFAAPVLCWLCGRAVGVSGHRALLAVVISFALALAAVGMRGDEPLHANGHAWREAREILRPVGGRMKGFAPFLHGKGGISLAWLVAAAEQRVTGATDPFHISRVAGAAAAGAAAVLGIVLVGSVWAGLAAGCVVALSPLGRMLAVSGSPLAIPAWILPWSLALLLAAGLSASRALLAGATLAVALGTLTHTAMLAWPAALLVAWALTARREIRASGAAFAALLVVGVAWVAEVSNCYDMLVQRNGEGSGLLASALRGFEVRDLFFDPSWTSPMLIPLVLLWVMLNLRRKRWALMTASTLPAALVAIPFFAVTACSSDAVRYQGALLGLVTSLAVAGLWSLPVPNRIGSPGTAVLRAGVLASLVVFPLPSRRQPVDPSVVEHRLVLDAARRMQPGTLVILPSDRFAGGRVIPEFPDFVLPAGSLVVLRDDPRAEQYRGPRLLYLGLACISWNRDELSDDHPPGMRPECLAMRGGARPWLVRSLGARDIPRARNGEPWTFHQLSLDEPFGFFEP